MKNAPLFLDLFAGAGGLAEGFIQSGFKPLAYVEADQAACFTLRTRMAYHWMKAHRCGELYVKYLNGGLSRSEFYACVPEKIISSVINAEIGADTLPDIFRQIDALLGKRKLELIIGGPPCQGYSIVGRSRDENRMRGDRRNNLYLYYAEFLKRYKPSYFVFENVKGLLSARDENGILYFETMKNIFLKCGYEVQVKEMSAEDYGVLQKRKRIIIVGGRDNLNFFPEPGKWNPEVRVEEIFSDLPKIYAGGGGPGPCSIRPYTGSWQIEAGIRSEGVPVTWHQARPHTAQDLEIYRLVVESWNCKGVRLSYNELPERLKTHDNRKSFLDRFKVVASDLPYSHTVVAHIAKDGHYYIHPDINQNRSITPREAARLQTFPDDYYFESKGGVPGRTPAFQQIGNAVPVLLARKIADKLKEAWQ